MAADSQTGVPSWTRSGTLPLGLSRRYSGVCVYPLFSSIVTLSHGMPSSSNTTSVIMAVLIADIIEGAPSRITKGCDSGQRESFYGLFRQGT